MTLKEEFMMTEKEMEKKCIEIEKKLYELVKDEYSFKAVTGREKSIMEMISADKALMDLEYEISKIALEKLSVDETINDDIISIVKQNENSFRSLGYYANNSDYDENLKIIINGEIKRRWECIKQYIRDNDLLKYNNNVMKSCKFTTTMMIIIIGQKMEHDNIN